MSFDRIAPFYGWMERWLAGGCMQRCRVVFLGRIRPPSRALLAGEGHGRFLVEFRKRFPDTWITVVDASPVMLEISQRKAAGDPRVEFVCCPIGEWSTERKFDLIATHFLLDCFTAEELDGVIGRIGSLAEPGADWLISDFSVPDRGPSRWRAKAIVRMLYVFFGATTGLGARELVPFDERIRDAGFVLEGSVRTSWGMLRGDHWRRTG